ncbi:MAG: hypothetical protein HY062_06120 [Bacteroidetes bacterium]|nr:hypothetical protein [Bacteroidota bacterium]
MKTFKYIFNCLSVIIFAESCSGDQQPVISNEEKILALEWITGDYYMKSTYGHYYEKWQKKDSVTYYGLGYFMDPENEDTLFRQRMKLRQAADGVFMYFNVKNQNDNKDVEFRLTKQENQVYTFENSFRDYPSIVTYKILSDSAVNVVMRGFKNGEEKIEDFIISK